MSDYDKATKEVIEWLNLTPSMSAKEIKSEISKAFTQKYGKKVPKGVLNGHIDDFTESVCLQFGISC